MAVALTHTTVATGTDAGNAEIGKTQWNESHTLTMATSRLLGRTTAGAGAVEEISAGAGLTLSAGSLAVSKTLPSGDIVGTTDTQTLTNKTLTDAALIGSLTEDVFTITDGSSVDINPANGTIQLWTLGANRTPTAASFAAGQSVTLMIADGSAFAVTWTTIGVVWVGGTAPTLPTSGYAVITLWKVGSTVYGAGLGNVA